MRFYDKIGFGGVTIVPRDRDSANVPGLPGISIREDAITGNEFAAISELVHEAQHDFAQHGVDSRLFPLRTHEKIKEVVPTVNPASSPAGDDLSQFVNFLMSIRTVTGATLWDAIQREAGSRPAPP